MKILTYISFGVILGLPTVSFANGVEYGHMMDWSGGMMGGTWGVLGLITWVVWLIVGILAVVWLFQQINKK